MNAAVSDPLHAHNQTHTKETMEEAEKMTNKSRSVDDSSDIKSTPTNGNYEEASNDLVGSREAFEDLKCLIKFMDRHLTPITKQFRERNREWIQFHELWFLFNLGDIVYSPKKRAAPESLSQERFQSYHTTYRVCAKHGGRPLVKQDDSKTQPQLRDRVRSFGVDCYYIDYDGKSFIPVHRRFDFLPFEGKRKITSCEVYPLEYAEYHAALKHGSINQGVKFKSALRIKHMLCIGPTYISDPDGTREPTYSDAVEQINSEVIIDFAEAKKQKFVYENRINDIYTKCIEEGYNAEFEEDYPIVVWEDRDEKVAQSRSDDVIFNDTVIETRCAAINFNTDPFLRSVQTNCELSNNTHEPMRDEDIMLVTGRVVAYVLRDRKFAMLNVENMRSLNPNPDGFVDLKLPSGHKEMVQALVRSHSMKRDNNLTIEGDINHDIVAGKGRGLIILLHGVPGVGKTSTAECIAESTGKPLFPITCGDLGLSPRDVEQSLKEIFQLAQLWDCVLLLDEADVFLSQRTKTDLQRNALVSGESDPLCGKEKTSLTIIVFLRVLEYYQGILFLTTNRVGAFDEAFKSRIHISLYYPELAKVQSLKIWEMNLERAKKIDLERTRTPTMSGMIIDEEDIKSYAEIHWIENQNGVGKWNGRQIRNAFQTASALALYEAHMVNARRLAEDPDAEITPPQLKRKHFEKVAKATSQFGEYMRDTIGKDDADASHYRGDRTDHFHQKARAARQPANPQMFSQPYTPPHLQQHYPRTPPSKLSTTRHPRAALHSGPMRSDPSTATESFVDETHYYESEYHDRTGGLGPMDPNLDDEMEYE